MFLPSFLLLLVLKYNNLIYVAYICTAQYIKRQICILTEEKKPAKEESESEDDDMGFGLFD